MFLLYDAHAPDTFQYVEEALKCIPQQIPKLIIANKAGPGLESNPNMLEYVKSLGLEVFECNAKESSNIVEIFYHFTRQILRIESNSNNNPCEIVNLPRKLSCEIN